MTLSNSSSDNQTVRDRPLTGNYPEYLQVTASAVSWAAVVAGAAAIAALSLILLMLGTGLGLSSVSPWAFNGVSATTFGVTTILWLTFTQAAASGMGGYLVGRLRTKWTAVPMDEAHFRDTAHGFLAWAVATLATAALLTTVIGSIVSGGIQAGASVAGGVASTATAAAASGAAGAGSEMTKSGDASELMGYFVDSLFRKDVNAAKVPLVPDESDVLSRDNSQRTLIGSVAEVTRIFMNTVRTESLPVEDIRYVGQIVARRTGLTQPEAEQRVIDTYARVQNKLRDAENAAKEAADKARKASAYAALWLFISLLIGAFVASYMATVGGRQRDNNL